MSHIHRSNDRDLHNEDGSHRGTASDVETHARRMIAHLNAHAAIEARATKEIERRLRAALSAVNVHSDAIAKLGPYAMPDANDRTADVRNANVKSAAQFAIVDLMLLISETGWDPVGLMRHAIEEIEAGRLGVTRKALIEIEARRP